MARTIAGTSNEKEVKGGGVMCLGELPKTGAVMVFEGGGATVW